VTTITSKDGDIIIKTVDENNRPLIKRIDKNGNTIIRKLDENGKPIFEEYDKDGKLISNPREIDEDGNIIEKIKDKDGNDVIKKTDINGNNTFISKDENGNEVIKKVDKDGNTLIEQTDKNGNKIQKRIDTYFNLPKKNLVNEYNYDQYKKSKIDKSIAGTNIGKDKDKTYDKNKSRQGIQTKSQTQRTIDKYGKSTLNQGNNYNIPSTKGYLTGTGTEKPAGYGTNYSTQKDRHNSNMAKKEFTQIKKVIFIHRKLSIKVGQILVSIIALIKRKKKRKKQLKENLEKDQI